MLKEFKEFISRGPVLDLAVGVIIGAAFGKIVTSLVDNVFMPIVGMLIGGLDFSELSIKVGDATLKYGAFIQSVIDFLIVALCIFLFIKLINKAKDVAKRGKKEEKEEAPKPEDIQLLEEIRDLLKKGKK